MKKLFLLSVLMLLPMLANADVVEIDGIYYYFIEEIGQAKVTQNPNNYLGYKYSGSVEIPESVVYEGKTYRMLHVSDADDFFSGDIVCGIGHLTSFFPERLMNNGDGIRVEGLRCYWVEDELVFNPEGEDCDAIYSDLHGIEEDGPSTGSGTLLVYPNPTDGVLVIETHDRASLQGDTYRISNMMGQVLLQGQIMGETQRIDVSSLPQGMYFITVGEGTRKFVVNR